MTVHGGDKIGDNAEIAVSDAEPKLLVVNTV
jgi:hypothetical protein